MRPFRLPSRDSRGNVATLSALLAVPLIVAMGAGIDVSRAWSARAQLQGAVDAAALSVMKEAAFKQAEAERHARRMIEANFKGEFSALQVQFSDIGATVTARTSVGLTLTGLLGIETLDADVSGTAEYPPTRYEIALVLDTTASMSGAKLAEMKKAAQHMLRDMTDTEFMKRQVRFSVVPYATFVNVGADKAGADWIDGEGAVELPSSMIPSGVSRFDVFENFGETWKGCVETRLDGEGETHSSDDTPPDARDPNTLFVPLLIPDEPRPPAGSRYVYANDYVANSSLAGLGITFTETGRLVKRLVSRTEEEADRDDHDHDHDHDDHDHDRDDDDDDDDDAPEAGDDRGAARQGAMGKSSSSAVSAAAPLGSKTRGPNAGCDVQPIRPLTQDHASVSRSITALTAAGSTNIAEGVSWGNRVLSPGEPFPEAQSYQADVKKIMVVLADGDNAVPAARNPNLSTYAAFGYVADGRWDAGAAARNEPTGCYLSPEVLSKTTGRKPRFKVDKNDKPRRHPDDPMPVNCQARPADLPMPKNPPSEAAVSRAMDGMTQRACDAAKAEGVEVYTIRLEVDTPTSSELLRNCASDASHYYDVTDAAQLQAIFDDIANRIKTLRISS